MSSWGTSPYECDEGLDIKEMWEYWVEGVGSTPIEYDDAIKRFFDRWGESIKYGDSITNNEIIALTALHFDNDKDIPKKLTNAAEEAINRELEETELDKWQESEQENRKRFLLDFLNKINGKRKKPKSPNVFLDPALVYRSSEDAKKSIIKGFSKLKKSKYPIGFKKAGLPEFFSTLNRFMTYGVWEKDTAVYIKAKNERNMMLATYLAIELNWTEERLRKFLDEMDK